MNKYIVVRKHKELLITLILLISSFIIFNVLFSNSTPGSYYQNLISALIGTLLTVTITAFLLKKQAKSNEVKERNVEVFRKKVERYERVIQLLNKVLEDGKIDEKEAKEIKSAIYDLALFSSEETIKIISKFLRHKVVKDYKKGEEITFFHVISQFRKDLHLNDVDNYAVSDLDSIDSLLDIGFDKINVYNNIYKYFKVLRETIKRDIRYHVGEDEYNNFTVSKIEGTYGWLEFIITHEDGILEHVIAINYPQNLEELDVEISSFNIFDLSDMEKEENLFSDEMKAIRKISKSQGFQFIDFESDNDSSSHFYKSYPIRFISNESSKFKITSRDLHVKITEAILALEMFTCNSE